MAPALAGVAQQISFIHSLQVDYTKTLSGTALNDISNLTSLPQGYEVTGLTSPILRIVDARFPSRPALVPFDVELQDDGSYSAQFVAGSGGAGRFFIVPEGAELTPLGIGAKSLKPIPQNLRYLTVGPAQFASALQPFIAARSKEGLHAAFIDQEQLFDFYNFGRYGKLMGNSAGRAGVAPSVPCCSLKPHRLATIEITAASMSDSSLPNLSHLYEHLCPGNFRRSIRRSWVRLSRGRRRPTASEYAGGNAIDGSARARKSWCRILSMARISGRR